MDLIQFMTILQKAFTLEANATGMNTVKNQNSFSFQKSNEDLKTVKNLLLMTRKLQTRHKFQNI